MKSKSILIILLSIIVRPEVFSQENAFVVNSYVVEYSLRVGDSQSAKPIYERTIALNGTATAENNMTRAVLNFTSDKKKHAQKPVYDPVKKEAMVWYPLSEFESYYNMLNHKKGNIKVGFHASSTLQTKTLYIITNGLAPLED